MAENSFYPEAELRSMGFRELGHNVLISRFARFYGIGHISIGNNVRIDDFSILSGRISIGNFIHISSYCAFYGGAGITMEDYSGTSPGCRVFSISDDFSGDYLIGPMVPENARNVNSAPVLIGRYSQIGAGTIILPGVTIGEGVAVGAMSLVSRSLDEWGVYAGSPVRFIKQRSKGLLDRLP